MNLTNNAFDFNRSGNYDEKAVIIQTVAKEMGHGGMAQLSNLTGYTPERLAEYAVLPRFFEDRNRRRRQRKPKERARAGDFIEEDFYRERRYLGLTF